MRALDRFTHSGTRSRRRGRARSRPPGLLQDVARGVCPSQTPHPLARVKSTITSDLVVSSRALNDRVKPHVPVELSKPTYLARRTPSMKQRQRGESPMRPDGGLQRAVAVLLQATLAIGILIGCGVTSRPADETLDLPHFANQAPSKEMEPSPRLSVSRETVWAQ